MEFKKDIKRQANKTCQGSQPSGCGKMFSTKQLLAGDSTGNPVLVMPGTIITTETPLR